MFGGFATTLSLPSILTAGPVKQYLQQVEAQRKKNDLDLTHIWHGDNFKTSSLEFIMFAFTAASTLVIQALTPSHTGFNFLAFCILPNVSAGMRYLFKSKSFMRRLKSLIDATSVSACCSSSLTRSSLPAQTIHTARLLRLSTIC